MKDSKFQEDLFGASVSGEKPPKRPPSNGYVSGQRHLPYIKIPTEFAVIAAIFVLIMLTVSYAAGIRSGRRAERGEAAEVFSEFADISVDPGVFAEEIAPSKVHSQVGTVAMRTTGGIEHTECSAELSAELFLSHEGILEKPEAISEVDTFQEESFEFSDEMDIRSGQTDVEEPASGEYMIYIAAFRDRVRAEEAAMQARSMGKDSGIRETSGWYQVYTFGYETIEEARSSRDELSAFYPDCYIRRKTGPS